MNSVENLSGEELLNKAHSLQIVLRTKPYNLIHHEGPQRKLAIKLGVITSINDFLH